MEQPHTKLHVTGAFVAGVLLCLAVRDFYPSLEWRSHRRLSPALNKTIVSAGFADEEHIDLEDHENVTGAERVGANVPEGIEACIGNTPLFKVKSLSDITGCEILGKAEVISKSPNTTPLNRTPDVRSVSQWWRW